MSDGFAYGDIIILALIAGFILLRLRSVLGQKIGHDPTQPGPLRPQTPEAPLIKIPQIGARPVAVAGGSAEDVEIDSLSNETVRAGVRAIRAADREFSLQGFMAGARGAFEMVFDAFAKDDRETLKMLLAPPVYSLFEKELEARRQGDRRPETTLLAVTSQDIAHASLEKSMARIGVRFVSEQVSLVRDKEGKVIEGDPAASEHVEAEWVFEREVNSRNPNWKIIDT